MTIHYFSAKLLIKFTLLLVLIKIYTYLSSMCIKLSHTLWMCIWLWTVPELAGIQPCQVIDINTSWTPARYAYGVPNNWFALNYFFNVLHLIPKISLKKPVYCIDYWFDTCVNLLISIYNRINYLLVNYYSIIILFCPTLSPVLLNSPSHLQN